MIRALTSSLEYYLVLLIAHSCWTPFERFWIEPTPINNHHLRSTHCDRLFEPNSFRLFIEDRGRLHDSVRPKFISAFFASIQSCNLLSSSLRLMRRLRPIMLVGWIILLITTTKGYFDAAWIKGFSTAFGRDKSCSSDFNRKFDG